ncbi:MAG: class I SAM-dependent methyltransferase [Chlorobiaceae bacterium]
MPFLQVPDRFDRSGVVQWKLVQSTASGLIMLNPRPEKSEAPGHYRSASYDPYLESGQGGTARQRLYLAARKLLLGYRASLVLSGSARADRKLSILEIGCSTGDLLNHLHKRRGIPAGQLAGIEPDGQAAAYARNSCRITVCSSVGESKAITGPFDRIVLWHALEHIQDLHETIVFAAERLKKDGELVVALPNPASADAAHYRENWIAWDAPRHLWHFTPDTLEKLLERHGLSIWKRLPYLPDALYNTLHSEKLRSRRENRPFTVLSIGRSLLKAAAFALKRAADPSKASTLVYWARKA